ncbi:MAG: hypothetical protein OQJ81_04790, partial [Melioribacteraceae bacterium]|nr:hypothetical protein [Melioribacteraceae bacterium]
MLKSTIKYCILIIISATILFGQNNYDKKFIRIAPGLEYKAGAVHEFFFGEHWRDLWVTAIDVEILDLEKFANGLTPLKKGGGFQTKSLRLLGKDGNIWKFRSMAKDPAKVLPKVLRETVVADIFQDQISSANPLAALVAAPILEEVGILQAKPILVYMPDSPLLGEFRKDFGNQLGMIEIHPDIDEDENRTFEGADKIESTLDLFERLEKKTDEKIDAKNYLTARLIDLFLGDWDRHTDQWKWARYESGGIDYWKPIPRDRDQVFAKWDGLGPRVAAYLVPQFVHFDYEYPDIEDITWSGRFIDRRFLTELTLAEWDSITSKLVSKLSDKLIENSVGNLPPEHFALAGEELIEKLISRRNLLNAFSKEYYLMINKVVDIYGTNKDDYVQVDRLNDEATKVVLFNTSKKTKTKNVIFSKIFKNNITNDIRIYLLDGDDKAVVNGEADSSPLVRIIGGDGKDTLIDRSKVNGFILGIVPISKSESKTEFYDSGKKTFLDEGSGTYYNNDKLPKPKDEYEKYEPKLRDRSVDWLPSPLIGFNSSDGFVFGAGAQLYSYNFRMSPYEYWFNLTADYATRPASINLNFNGIFNSLVKGATITIDVHKSELLFTNYYGVGNETTFDDELEDEEYYRIDEDLF